MASSIFGKAFQESIAKLLSGSIALSLLPVLVVGSLIGSATVANATGFQQIQLETATATANPSSVLLGSLASRSTSLPTGLSDPEKVLTRSVVNGENVYTGQIDSQTAFSFISTKNYANTGSPDFAIPGSNLKQSIDVTDGNRTALSFTGTGLESYLGVDAFALKSSGSLAKRVTNGGSTFTSDRVTDPFISAFGPQIWSSPFPATQNQSLSYQWAALGTGDDFEIYSFLVKTNISSGACSAANTANVDYGLSSPTTTHTLLTYSRGKSQPWKSESGTIPSDGCYRFRFVSGTYDATGGLVVGGNLFVGASTIYLGETQTLTFPQPANVDASGSRTVVLGASSDRTGATLVYTTSTSSVCDVTSGGIVTVKTTGTCQLLVSSGPFGIYSAATSVGTSFTITALPPISSATSSATQRPGSLITFAQNGADNNSLPQTEILGETRPLWKNIMTRAGYTFIGWNTKADGTGTAYADGASFKFEAPLITLYAQWKLTQTKPAITWGIPAAIQEGTALSATQLNALASTAGTYTYSPAAAALLPVGKHTLKVTFVPTDPKFETVETTVEIEVLAKPRVTWANPAAIQEGTGLSSTQLNAVGSVPGIFSYAPATGTLLAVGKQTLRVTFTPTDRRLSTVTAEVVIDVTAKPEIIPAPPVSPTYSVTGAPKTSINWGAGENAASYTVLVDGKSACAVAALTCDVARLLGPKNVVTVTSVAASGKTSAAVRATYSAPASAQVLSVVNFDSARAVIKSTEAAKLRAFAATVRAAGYTSLTVYGHTDSVGGVDNQKLSIARANSTITFLKRLLPNVKFVRSGFAAGTPVADNSTTEGKAANRRAEVFIP
jgi:outer membrane protein OmpA-like peptidoglycan-associated protein